MNKSDDINPNEISKLTAALDDMAAMAPELRRFYDAINSGETPPRECSIAAAYFVLGSFWPLTLDDETDDKGADNEGV